MKSYASAKYVWEPLEDWTPAWDSTGFPGCLRSYRPDTAHADSDPCHSPSHPSLSAPNIEIMSVISTIFSKYIKKFEKHLPKKCFLDTVSDLQYYNSCESCAFCKFLKNIHDAAP